MKLLFKVLIPVLVLVGSVFGAKTILENRPEPFKRPQFPSVQAVEATTLKKSDYPVVIRSQGTVQPTKSSTLVAEVTGTIIDLSENFVIGGSFSAGDVLLQIDERDYTIALTQAEANLAQATAALQEETARGQLAKTEWESLGRGKKASAFTLRLPQLAASRANRDAAQAQVERAKLDLERTRFVAPYDGQVLDSGVDQGQFVTRGSRLGQIYSTSSVDVRLPLSSRQLTFLDIPKSGNIPTDELPAIELSAIVGGAEQKWTGNIVRAEGVDAATQQLNVIARVERPTNADSPALRIGQYVKANINGRVLKDVFVLPRTAVREDGEVLLVNEDSKLERRQVSVAWSDDQTTAISDGLQAGDVLVTTALSTVTNGTPVRATVDGKAPPKRQGRPAGAGGEGRPAGAGGEGRPAGAGGEGRPASAGGAGRPEGARGAGRPEGARGAGRPEAAKQADLGVDGVAQRGAGERGEIQRQEAAGTIDRSNSVAN